MNDQPSSVLLVEDTRSHAVLVLRILRDNEVTQNVTHVWDGQAALDFLANSDPSVDGTTAPWPRLVLLDLRLPKIDGLEVLSRIKSTDRLKRIPVVVLTTSTSDVDMERAYANGANGYLVKPIQFQQLSQMLIDVGSYWLGWNRISAH